MKREYFVIKIGDDREKLFELGFKLFSPRLKQFFLAIIKVVNKFGKIDKNYPTK